ncbi:MAG: hypothetical protein WD187_00925 [Candidatus Woykebacteria bacterium]
MSQLGEWIHRFFSKQRKLPTDRGLELVEPAEVKESAAVAPPPAIPSAETQPPLKTFTLELPLPLHATAVEGPMVEEKVKQSAAEAPSSPNDLVADGKPPRSCPRCNGSMLFEEDLYGAFSTCLACGYVYEFGATASLEVDRDSENQRQRRYRPRHGRLHL